MNLLIDTHVLLWSLNEPERLPKSLSDTLIDPENEIWVSAISLWEIVIKVQQRKLSLPEDWFEGIRVQRFRVLPFEPAHALAVSRLPLYHRDPFDRGLLAQASVEKLVVVTSDTEMRRYNREVNILNA